MTDLLPPLFSAYLAYLPWLILVIGLVFIILGSTIGRKNRRATVIGLWMTAVASLWVVLQMLYPGG